MALSVACGATPAGEEETQPPGSSGTSESAPTSATESTQGVTLPEEAAHVHGVAVEPDTGEVLVATHAGLFVVPPPGGDKKAAPEQVGPTIDLMGFAVAGPGRLVASGHPGPGTDMPNPVGLIESRDGGESWQALSLAGASDFHSLAASEERIVGFDGRLRASDDGTAWETLAGGLQPVSLALSDDGRTIVATTERGPMRSTDGGGEFAPVEDAPLLALVDWVAGTDSVYGVTVEGKIHRSDDAGTTWTSTGSLDGQPHALHADAEQLIVVADHQVRRSTDEGTTFQGW
ncbi:hypothetical protein GCM10022402_10360 [Salinactinospora qingdaonensis]|uniref:Exo-alpha-sialidase n=1 Tax=Salinactinospora qingdaonensis TaxID=702744 RepID=A0ABP7F562_9ACTN